MACNRRNTKWLLLLVACVVCVCLSFNVNFTTNGALDTQDQDSAVHQDLSHLQKPSRQVEVQLKSIIPQSNGSVDMVLRLNLQDLLSSIDSSVFNNGEATSNPIPTDPGFLYTNEDFCSRYSNLQYIIYVHSSPTNTALRMNIRNTWANPELFLDGRTKVVFIMGQTWDQKATTAVRGEIEKYNDVVQGDFIDEYKNLTLKGILGLKWLSNYCKHVHFAIKADDDAFVNIFKLITLLNRYHDQKRLVTCPLWKENSMPILRDASKCMKWCVKYTEFPGLNYFPKYCAGLSFVLSRDVISDMYHAASTTPFFWIDDVYVTGLLLGKIKNVEYVDILKNFTLKEKLAVEQYTDMQQPTTYYISHIRQPENMGVMWRATLKRLSAAMLLSVNPVVYNQYAELRKKVQNAQQPVMNRRLLLMHNST